MISIQIKSYFIILVGSIFFLACKSEPTNSQSTIDSNSASSQSEYHRISQTPAKDREMQATDITIKITNGIAGSYSLVGMITDQYFRVDSARMQNDELRFKRDDPLPPGLYYVSFPDNKTSLQLLLDADQKFTITTDQADLAGKIKVEGSIDNDLLYQAFAYENQLDIEHKTLNEEIKKYKDGDPEYQHLINERVDLNKKKLDYLTDLFKKHPTSLFTAFKEAGQNPLMYFSFLPDGTIDNDTYVYDYRNRFWENVNFADTRLLRTPVITNKLNRYMTKLTPQQPDSLKKYASLLIDQTLEHNDYFKYIANWVAIKYEPTKTTLMDPEAIFVHMIQNYFTRERAFWADSMTIYGLQGRANEMAASLVGKKGPNVTAANPRGEMKTLLDSEADYLIVYLWNPNCEHCQIETPKLVDFYNKWKDQGIDVYSIVIDTNDKEWKQATNKYQLPFTNVYDPTNRAIYAKYYVDVTPELYVLNPERTIIGKNLKVDQVEIIINRDKEKR